MSEQYDRELLAKAVRSIASVLSGNGYDKWKEVESASLTDFKKMFGDRDGPYTISHAVHKVEKYLQSKGVETEYPSKTIARAIRGMAEVLTAAGKDDGWKMVYETPEDEISRRIKNSLAGAVKRIRRNLS